MEHIKLLVETVPHFCQIEKLDGGDLIRIDRKVIVKEVKEMLQVALKKL